MTDLDFGGWVCPTPLRDTPNIVMATVGPSRTAGVRDRLLRGEAPMFFPGGSIGDLAVNGTVNDLAMSGATPLSPLPWRSR